MLEQLTAKYKKTWLVSSCVARELLCLSMGDRLPTIKEFTEKLVSSRGIVQNALDDLQQKGGISLEKRGKMGTYITGMNRSVLFSEAGLGFITATMPAPLTDHLKSLASGICESMAKCPASFSFAFIECAARRAEALSRQVYDFVITSVRSAQWLCARNPDLALMLSLEGCMYSPPYVLCSNKPGIKDISSGDSIAADPRAIDQYHLTKQLCEGKETALIERPYITCRAMFLSGAVDFLVYRREQWLMNNNIQISPIEFALNEEYQIPAVLINRKNYNIANILKPYLETEVIAEGQTAVLERRREMILY